MVAQIEQSNRAQRRRLEKELKARFKKDNIQAIINSLFWKIVARNGGMISIDADEIKQVPANSSLNVQYDTFNKKLIVKSVLVKSNIITPPNNGLII